MAPTVLTRTVTFPCCQLISVQLCHHQIQASEHHAKPGQICPTWKEGPHFWVEGHKWHTAGQSPCKRTPETFKGTRGVDLACTAWAFAGCSGAQARCDVAEKQRGRSLRCRGRPGLQPDGGWGWGMAGVSATSKAIPAAPPPPGRDFTQQRRSNEIDGQWGPRPSQHGTLGGSYSSHKSARPCPRVKEMPSKAGGPEYTPSATTLPPRWAGRADPHVFLLRCN